MIWQDATEQTKSKGHFPPHIDLVDGLDVLNVHATPFTSDGWMDVLLCPYSHQYILAAELSCACAEQNFHAVRK